jgi:signal transduction histidine kinase
MSSFGWIVDDRAIMSPTPAAANCSPEVEQPTDPRATAVLAVLAGRPIAGVAVEAGVHASVLQRWVASFVAAGTASLAGAGSGDPVIDLVPERFLTVLAHEVRTPLAAATAGMRLLADPRMTSGGRADVHRLVGGRLTQLARLCDDVLDAASVVLGRLPLQPVTVDVRSIVAEALQEQADPRLQLLPGPEVAVRSDQRRLRQVVVNLADSALRHGLGTVRVQVEEASGGWGTIRFTAHAQRRVGVVEAQSWFEPFDAPGGSGHALGLYVVRTLVVAQGGTSGVDSAACAGGTSGQDLHFWVRLPLAVDPTSDRETT